VSHCVAIVHRFLDALEHGEKEPCLNTLDLLAKSFGMNIVQLTDGPVIENEERLDRPDPNREL
jgi:transcriptional regulator with XRE-family HTH domain